MSGALWFLLLSASLVSATNNTRRTLQDSLEAKKSRFEKSLMPSGPNVTVTGQLYIYCLFGLDDREVMEMSGWVELAWVDPRFRWSPADWDNISTLEMSSDHMWIPDVGIWNAKEPENADLRAKAIRTLIVKPSGRISAFLPILVNIPCPIDSVMFPFDQQVCTVKLGTVNSPRSYYQLVLGGVNFGNAMKTLVGEWRPVGYRQKLSSTYYPPGDTYFDVYSVDIILDRKPLYHIVLVIIPFVLLTVIALVMFLAQEAGDRVSISIAIVLAMTLYVMITSQNAPKSMHRIPLLGMYLMIQMSLLIAFTFAAVMCAIAPSMAAQGEEQGRKTLWHFLKEHQRCLDTSGFLLYLLSTVVNSGVCLILIPFLQVKHDH